MCRPAINAARGTLPSNLPQNPTYRKVNPADAPIMILAMTSDSITKPDMYDAADSILAQKLSQVEGIGQVFVGGAAQPAVRAELNPTQLNNTGVGLDLVRTALGTANANQAKGQLSGEQECGHHQRQRPDLEGLSIQRPDCRLSQWISGKAFGCRHRAR